jgi:hypothetical protein
MNTGKILIGLSLVMVAVAMMMSPSNAAEPGTTCVSCHDGIFSPQMHGTYPGSADGSRVSAHDPLPSMTRTDQSSTP